MLKECCSCLFQNYNLDSPSPKLEPECDLHPCGFAQLCFLLHDTTLAIASIFSMCPLTCTYQ